MTSPNDHNPHQVQLAQLFNFFKQCIELGIIIALVKNTPRALAGSGSSEAREAGYFGAANWWQELIEFAGGVIGIPVTIGILVCIACCSCACGWGANQLRHQRRNRPTGTNEESTGILNPGDSTLPCEPDVEEGISGSQFSPVAGYQQP